MISSESYAAGLARGMQIKSGNAGRHIKTRLPLHRHRLQFHGAIRAADQDVGADTGTDRRLGEAPA